MKFKAKAGDITIDLVECNKTDEFVSGYQKFAKNFILENGGDINLCVDK